jgi:NADPH:quinone reductase-like Zn-dependent oxidoreductase
MKLKRILKRTTATILLALILAFELNKADLTIPGDLMQSGKMTPVIDRRYKLSDVPAALRYLKEGHARGKAVITVEQDNKT